MLLNEDLKTNNITDILSGISPDTVQRIDQLKTNFKKLVRIRHVIHRRRSPPAHRNNAHPSGELCQAMKKIGVEELNDTPAKHLYFRNIYI